MMKRLGHPFILFADPRLEGGSFYLGSAEYEAKIKAVIEESLAKLGFTNKELVLSGISMGTTGAIYYGSKIGARAVIVGKPLINLGTIALNNTLIFCCSNKEKIQQKQLLSLISECYRL